MNLKTLSLENFIRNIFLERILLERIFSFISENFNKMVIKFHSNSINKTIKSFDLKK